MLKNLPSKVSVIEVGPRDGLQNEKNLISTEDKVILIDKLSQTGLTNIEITSFVHPKWTPQLADAMEVSNKIKRLDGINYMALVPNLKGVEKAITATLNEVSIFMSSSQAHNKKNLNRTIEESLEMAGDSIKLAKDNGLKVRAYLSTVFGCPYEGQVNIDKVSEIVSKLLAMGIYQVSLGDTIGIGNPKQVNFVLEKLFKVIESKEQLALHFHDTRGLGLANALVGLEMGITTFDSSIGGLGGCPYAPGATGNISTEDLVNMLHAMGVETGINLAKLVECNNFMQKVLNRELSSKYAKTFNATKQIPV